jgi:ASC-1-like (ASCH) protein
MTEKEFIEIISSKGPIKEIDVVVLTCRRYNKFEEMAKFIVENNLDFHNLWEDSESGDKAYDNYVEIIKKALSYKGVKI